MYTLISIFYASLIGIILMLLLKRGEVKTGHPSLISRLGRGTDRFFQSIFSSVKTFVSYINKHTFIALGHWVAFHMLVHVRKVYVEIKALFLANPHGKRMMDAVRGRGEIKKEGASFYLRRISDK
ncbi:MAG: hypothetical protein KBC33_02555 [Candidatus Pacebacteria bacterium]|nr:hypothetical protein [Candidatus Paceibacterota bacterium]